MGSDLRINLDTRLANIAVQTSDAAELALIQAPAALVPCAAFDEGELRSAFCKLLDAVHTSRGALASTLHQDLMIEATWPDGCNFLEPAAAAQAIDPDPKYVESAVENFTDSFFVLNNFEDELASLTAVARDRVDLLEVAWNKFRDAVQLDLDLFSFERDHYDDFDEWWCEEFSIAESIASTIGLLLPLCRSGTLLSKRRIVKAFADSMGCSFHESEQALHLEGNDDFMAIFTIALRLAFSES